VSLLIPARNEEASIGAAVESALASTGVRLEVIVLDDQSDDATARIVQRLAESDPRLRLAAAPPLPDDWCGKQHACHVLAGLAGYDVLVFIDADVRLAPAALRDAADMLRRSGAGLVSGFPRQITGTLLEKLLLPMIHFVLLGFLPVAAMRRSTSPGFGAGCGQFIAVDRSAYECVGGHSACRRSMHEGIMLPRAFRRAGLHTDIFDATALATCRMYRNAREVWAGLAKNATEGMAAGSQIGFWTVMLLGGQVMPFALLAWLLLAGGSGAATTLAAIACVLAWGPRAIGAVRFRHSVLGAALHPLGVVLLLAIQWHAWIRQTLGLPAAWKGRAYAAQPAP